MKGQEEITWAWYNVTDWNNASPPAEKAYVTVKGYLDLVETEKDGVKRTFAEVKATSVEVAPPRDGAPSTSTPAAAPDASEDPFAF